MNLKGLKISNLIVITGMVLLIATGLIKWYIGILIIIYLLEIKLNE